MGKRAAKRRSPRTASRSVPPAALGAPASTTPPWATRTIAGSTPLGPVLAPCWPARTLENRVRASGFSTPHHDRGVTRETRHRIKLLGLSRSKLAAAVRRAHYPDNSYEEFAYDKSGNRSSLTTAGGTASYAVDDADQLLSVTGPGQSEITTFGWTPNGEMASQLASGQTTLTSYSWGVRSTMSLVSMPMGRIVTFTYLPTRSLGWEFRSTGPGNLTTQRLWDAVTGNPLADLRGDFTPLGLHLSGLGMDLNVAEATIASTDVRVLLADHSGSIVKVMSHDAAVIGVQRFAAYGHPRTPPLPSTISSVGYVGRDGIDNASIVHLRARKYQGWLGTFLTRDPIHSDSKNGITLYGYARNSPVVIGDPTGLKAELRCFEIKKGPANFGRHCELFVDCPERPGWDPNGYVLTVDNELLTSYDAPEEGSGKAWPAYVKLQDRAKRNYVASFPVQSKFAHESEQCNDCTFELRLLRVFSTSPDVLPYYAEGPNSNTFVSTIIGRAQGWTSLTAVQWFSGGYPGFLEEYTSLAWPVSYLGQEKAGLPREVYDLNAIPVIR